METCHTIPSCLEVLAPTESWIDLSAVDGVRVPHKWLDIFDFTSESTLVAQRSPIGIWGDDHKDYDDYDHNDRQGWRSLCNVGRSRHNIGMWSLEHHATPSWSRKGTVGW